MCEEKEKKRTQRKNERKNKHVSVVLLHSKSEENGNDVVTASNRILCSSARRSTISIEICALFPLSLSASTLCTNISSQAITSACMYYVAYFLPYFCTRAHFGHTNTIQHIQCQLRRKCLAIILFDTASVYYACSMQIEFL